MTNSACPVEPAAASERFDEIDALRGLALFGIMLANLPNFIGLALTEDPVTVARMMGDLTQAQLNGFFNFVLDGKFYTIFSLLFGLGFALQLDRLDARGTDGRAIFRRRMVILFLIGIFHLSFIWAGDILTLYALIGFILPLFHRLPDRWLLGIAALLLFAVPLAGTAYFGQSDEAWTGPVFDLGNRVFVAAGGNLEVTYFENLRDLWWADLLPRAASEWIYVIGDKLYTWRIPKVMGTMILGMWAGRMLLRGQLIGNVRLLATIAIAGAAISIPANLVYAQQAPHAQTHWSSLIGTAPAGIAYAALFLLAAPLMPRVTTALAAAGRMALTNYLATSVICVAIFYGAGLGLMGSITLLQGWLFGLALFAAMLTWSTAWLKTHKQGPIEALWRKLTYPVRERTGTAPA